MQFAQLGASRTFLRHSGRLSTSTASACMGLPFLRFESYTSRWEEDSEMGTLSAPRSVPRFQQESLIYDRASSKYTDRIYIASVLRGLRTNYSQPSTALKKTILHGSNSLHPSKTTTAPTKTKRMQTPFRFPTLIHPGSLPLNSLVQFQLHMILLSLLKVMKPSLSRNRSTPNDQ